jgi:hypothetical protein
MWRKHKCKKPKHQPGFVNSAIFLTQFLQMCMLQGKTYATKSYLPMPCRLYFGRLTYKIAPNNPCSTYTAYPMAFVCKAGTAMPELCVMLKVSNLQIDLMVKRHFISLRNNTTYIYVITSQWTV